MNEKNISIRIAGLSDSELLASERKSQTDSIMQEMLRCMQDKMDGKVYPLNIHQPPWAISGNIPSFDRNDFAPKRVMSTAPAKSLPPAKLRAEQLAKDRCQTVAKLLWQQNPNLTIAELTRHPLIRDKEIAGGQFYEPRTVYDWIAEIKNHPQKNKRGRPRKPLK
jgi:hypothetical protein